MRFSDIHTHFVYGMDDGAQTAQEMEAMLDAAAADGVGRLIATPHMTPGVQPFAAERFAAHLAQARAYCLRRGYGLMLEAGAEMLYTPAFSQYLARHSLPPLGDSRQTLLEFAPDIPFAEIVEAAKLLERNGYVPVLAHVERYRALAGGNLRRLRAQSAARFQVNGSAVLGREGLLRGLRVRRWLRAGLIDYVASDSHDCQTRKTCMQSAYAALEKSVGAEYAGQLVGLCG